MKWNHILDKQPKDGEKIIQIDPPYKGHYSMGMRKYEQKCTFQELLDYCQKTGWSIPNFWWIYAEDFPFPNQPERLNELDSEKSMRQSEQPNERG